MNYLDFENANCKDCYKCLRSCPVKAIDARNRQAKIIEQRCILCGRCMLVCPQNAKRVHDSTAKVNKLIASGKRVIASVAPSFIASFDTDGFAPMRDALKKLGFTDAFETAQGAELVTNQYEKILKKHAVKNMITSACPAVNRAIQLYYPNVLKYLAPVDSPMVAHAKLLRQADKNAEIVFIGPCVAKKREADESGIIAAALTFEELVGMLNANNVQIENSGGADTRTVTRSKFYPIPRGIIKSFATLPSGYEYIAVDGVEKMDAVLKDLETAEGVFLELNACDHACINGPVALKRSALKANALVRSYANGDLGDNIAAKNCDTEKSVNIVKTYKQIPLSTVTPDESEIKAVLESIGKTTAEDELNCGACGYSTCREKAWAVLNGLAEAEMCVPYMREKAESMAYEVIQSSPNGIIVCNEDFTITDINPAAVALLGAKRTETVFDCFDVVPFEKAHTTCASVKVEKYKVSRTGKILDAFIVPIPKQKVLFAILTDITERVESAEKLQNLKSDTLTVTDEVINKQMRVAQEIASLLGETTAETKVALLQLKQTLLKED